MRLRTTFEHGVRVRIHQICSLLKPVSTNWQLNHSDQIATIIFLLIFFFKELVQDLGPLVQLHFPQQALGQGAGAELRFVHLETFVSAIHCISSRVLSCVYSDCKFLKLGTAWLFVGYSSWQC